MASVRRLPGGRAIVVTNASDGSTRVAVVITTYNHARFLDDAITSVLAQSVAVDEIIVVDDGSTDQPDRITDCHPTVRLIRQRRSGLAAARNTGWRAARSGFVVFLDADDRLKRNAIEINTARLLAQPEAAFSYGAYVNVGEHLDVVGDHVFFAADDGFADFLRGNRIGMHATVMYRRSVVAEVGGFLDGLAACEDYDLYLRIVRSHPVVHGDEILAEYRHHGSNMSHDSAMMLRSALDVLRSQKESARSAGLLSAYFDGVAEWKRYYVESWLTAVVSAVRSRALDMALVRQGVSLVSMAPITMITVAFEGFAARITARIRSLR
ncbi:MAG: glycosyltransferase family 2 protein [Solirubrobacterales bacterium]